MIYCVRFGDVVEQLKLAGFTELRRSPTSVVFRNDDGSQVVLRPPNADGNIPEILVNDAFDAAGLDPPAWDVFWCD